ncbi:hypothetical protein GCM10022409_40560 [Hymenobacter glaciei]|uniref:Uncharacterized protein n=1 Tax=Hymenobacter glaciei TaxID=877209 RepID=A0ABP7UQB8_9BACT
MPTTTRLTNVKAAVKLIVEIGAPNIVTIPIARMCFVTGFESVFTSGLLSLELAKAKLERSLEPKPKKGATKTTTNPTNKKTRGAKYGDDGFMSTFLE